MTTKQMPTPSIRYGFKELRRDGAQNQNGNNHTKIYEFWAKMGWLKKGDVGVVSYNNLGQGRWAENPENRRMAIRFLVENVLGKDPRKVRYADFQYNLLSYVVGKFYQGSPYAAIYDAYPEERIMPWEMHFTPKNFFELKKNRVKATRWLVRLAGKDPRDIICRDFEANGLVGLIDFYGKSPHKAVSEAFPLQHIMPWEMSVTPNGFYKSRTNRVAAIRWLMERLPKEGKEVVQQDFIDNRLRGLLFNYYNGSPYAALLDAGIVAHEDELYMKRRRAA